jgi:hypothetical protein
MLITTQGLYFIYGYVIYHAAKIAFLSGFRNLITFEYKLLRIRNNLTNLPLETSFSPGTYLGAKGVEFYHNNHQEIYNKVLRNRISKKWENEDLKIQFREIAHSIRNEKYNPRNNPRNNARKSIGNVLSKGSLLFSLAETINYEKMKYLS